MSLPRLSSLLFLALASGCAHGARVQSVSTNTITVEAPQTESGEATLVSRDDKPGADKSKAPPPGAKPSRQPARGNADTERTLARLRGPLRKCYTDGVEREGAMSGRVVVDAQIEMTGYVASAKVASNRGLSAGVAACLARVIRGARFLPPESGVASNRQIPVSFLQQD